MRVKIKTIDCEETALVWLTKADQEDAEVSMLLNKLRNNYTNLAVFCSGYKPLPDTIKIILSYQETKGL